MSIMMMYDVLGEVVVANLASEWYDVRVLSFVWIFDGGAFRVKNRRRKHERGSRSQCWFWLFSFLVIMKVDTGGTLSDRRDGIIRGRRARFGKVSLSLYNHITRSTIILADLLLVACGFLL